jgi:hypothetical protein
VHIPQECGMILETSFQGSYGNLDYKAIEGAVNIPIVEGKTRVAGAHGAPAAYFAAGLAGSA